MKTIGVVVELDKGVDATLSRWAEREERSKRRQAAVLLRRLAELFEERPEELQKLGLVQQRA
jgi:hypothetical protein